MAPPSPSRTNVLASPVSVNIRRVGTGYRGSVPGLLTAAPASSRYSTAARISVAFHAGPPDPDNRRDRRLIRAIPLACWRARGSDGYDQLVIPVTSRGSLTCTRRGTSSWSRRMETPRLDRRRRYDRPPSLAALWPTSRTGPGFRDRLRRRDAARPRRAEPHSLGQSVSRAARVSTRSSRRACSMRGSDGCSISSRTIRTRSLAVPARLQGRRHRCGHIVTPAEGPLPWAPRRSGRADARRCRDARADQGRAGRRVEQVAQCRGRAGESAPDAPEIIYCTAVAEPVGLLPEPAAGRADAKAARHGRPTAAPKR